MVDLPAMALLLQVIGTNVPPAPHPEAAGTYEYIACIRECGPADPAGAVVRGLIVLDTTGFGGRIEPRGSFACFVQKRLDKHHDSYLTIAPRGATSWSISGPGDSLRYRMYWSPDAGNVVTAVLTDSGFVGRAHSYGAGAAEIHVPDEWIVARRTGPPDRSRCPHDVRSPHGGGFFSRGLLVFLALGGALAFGISRLP